MSRIALSRLAGLRRFKDERAAALGPGAALDLLSDEWLSDRFLTRSDVQEKIDKVARCCDKLEVRDAGDDSNGRALVEILRANWCKCHAVCSVCSARLQGRRRSIYEPSVKDAARRYARAYMLTFTVADGPVLGERLDHLRASFRRWYRMGQRRGARRSGGEAAKIGASLAGVEITRTSAGRWHAHIHMLAFTDERLDYRVYDQAARRAAEARNYGRVSDAELRGMVARSVTLGGVSVPVSKLTEEWYASTGDSVNLDVRPLRGDWYAIQRSALEVLKYSTKLSTRAAGDPSEVVELIAGTHGRRLFMAMRDFRGLASSRTEYDDPGEPDYTIAWDYSKREYVGVRPDRRLPVKADVLGVVGVLVGQWRRERRAAVDNGPRAGLAAALDHMKAQYRAAIRSIWRAASRDAIVEACRGVLRPSPSVPVWIQTSLFGT